LQTDYHDLLSVCVDNFMEKMKKYRNKIFIFIIFSQKYLLLKIRLKGCIIYDTSF
jgi:hypothetical protein